MAAEPEHNPDAIDREILELLKQNGREPASRIARQVNLSAAAVQRRIDRLEAAQIIKGYTAAIDSGKLASSIDAYIEVSLIGNIDGSRVMGALIDYPEVREVVALAGNPDALVRVRVRSTAELGRLVVRLRELPEVIGTTSHIVIDRWWHGTPRPPAAQKP